MMNEAYYNDNWYATFDCEEAEMMNKAAKNYRVKIRNIDGTITELDECRAIQIELAKVQDNQLFMFTDKKLADRIEEMGIALDNLIRVYDGCEEKIKNLEKKAGSKRNDNRIEDLVNMVDVKLRNKIKILDNVVTDLQVQKGGHDGKINDLFDIVANLGNRLIELENGKDEPEFTTPDRVMDLMELCRNHCMSFAFNIDGKGLIISAKSNDDKHTVFTTYIPEHLIVDYEGIRNCVVRSVRKGIESMEEMRNGQTEEN